MPSIKDNLNAIKAEIKELNTASKDAANNTKAIGENLKFDPTNVRLVADRFKSLGEELKTNNELIAKYKKAISDLSTMRAGLDPKAKEYADDYNKLTKEIQRYETALKNTELRVKSLTAATDKNVQQQALVKAATEQTREKFEKWEKAAKTLSVTMLALVGIVTKLTSSALAQGKELYSLSRRYGTSAENIQIWNRALELATGESDLFTKSLQVMSKGLSTIPVGRGVAYNNALRGIGVSFKEIQNLDPTKQFEAILRGLESLQDGSLRASYAIQLFGDDGQNIARIFDEGGESIESYLGKANKFGVITQENAEKLANMSFELEATKSQLSEVAAEFVVALEPALEILSDIIREDIVPAVKAFSEWFKGLGKSGQKVFLTLIVIIAVLPKLIAGIGGVTKAVALAKAGFTALNAATAAWQPILLAVAAAITVIISLIAIFSKRARKAQEDFNQIVESANTLSDNALSYSGNVQSTSTSMTEKTVTINADIYGHGDTAISDEAAATVAQLTVDQLQKSLGDLIK